jgi:hypothetical protein
VIQQRCHVIPAGITAVNDDRFASAVLNVTAETFSPLGVRNHIS